MTEFEVSLIATRTVNVEAESVEQAREWAVEEVATGRHPWHVEEATVTGEKLGDEWVEVDES